MLRHMVGTNFTFVWSCQIVFLSDYIVAYMHQQCMRVPFALHPQLHFRSSALFSFSHSNKWHLIVVLICIYLVTKDVSMFTCAYWSFTSLLWWYVCSNSLQIKIFFLLLSYRVFRHFECKSFIKLFPNIFSLWCDFLFFFSFAFKEYKSKIFIKSI